MISALVRRRKKGGTFADGEQGVQIGNALADRLFIGA